MLMDICSNFLRGPTFWVARARVAVGDFLAQPWGWAKGGGSGGGGVGGA